MTANRPGAGRPDARQALAELTNRPDEPAARRLVARPETEPEVHHGPAPGPAAEPD